MTEQELPLTRDFHFRLATTNGIKLHVAEAGEGPPVLLLHGFPEFWYSWRHQLAGLSRAGYRAIAPDLRGYNKSDKPKGLASYRTKELVADVADLIGEVGTSPVVLVGHDWGGLIAWRVAALHPELVRGLVILNAPHPTAFRTELLRNPLQLAKSYYTFLFQLPALPERVLALNDYAIFARALRTHPHNHLAFSPADIEVYKQAWRTSGLKGPLNYYRAAMRYSGDLLNPPHHIEVPTCIIWGTRDPYLNTTLASRSARWASRATVRILTHASHWVQNDAPDEVTSGLLACVRENYPR